jgi:GTPase SAR1 family protein
MVDVCQRFDVHRSACARALVRVKQEICVAVDASVRGLKLSSLLGVVVDASETPSLVMDAPESADSLCLGAFADLLRQTREELDFSCLLQFMSESLWLVQRCRSRRGDDGCAELYHGGLVPSNVTVRRCVDGSYCLRLGALVTRSAALPSDADSVTDMRDWGLLVCRLVVSLVTLGDHYPLLHLPPFGVLESEAVSDKAMLRLTVVDDRLARVVMNCVRNSREVSADAVLAVVDEVSTFAPGSALSCRIRLCFVGVSNAGKSTVMNALIGGDFMPTAAVCETALVVGVQDSRCDSDAGGRLYVYDNRCPNCKGTLLATGARDISAKLSVLNAEFRRRYGSAVALGAFDLDGGAQFSGDVPHMLLCVPLPESLTGGAFGRNQLVLFDTPGPSEASNAAITANTTKMIRNSDAVCVVTDFESMRSDAEDFLLRYECDSVPVLALVAGGQLTEPLGCGWCRKIAKVKGSQTASVMYLANKVDEVVEVRR